MSKDLFEKRKLEFLETIIKEKKLPKIWEFRFSDGEDMRLWFNQISKIEKFKSYITEINNVLNEYNIEILTDSEKESAFLNCISNINRIPKRNEIYFSDNEDMYTWYMDYKINHRDFETIIHNNLSEFTELELATIWPLVKQEFINVLKILKRVPEHGEVILQNNIDVRVVYDKLKSHDPEFFEKLLLHLQTYNKNGLSIDDRVRELKEEVSQLGYIPFIQESRFSDKTDMFTWYMKYKNILPNLETELNSLIYSDTPNNNVNIYLIPNFKNSGGKFYTLCTNIGERLDLSNITSYENAKSIDSTLTKRGGLILKRNEEISSISFKKGKS